jgi:CheY-like chemotaxis protein
LVEREEKPKLRVDVTDNGIGIPEDKLANIFKPFVQADSSVTREFGGTGLGLAISQHMVNALGGSIAVRSEVGKGSVFSFETDTGFLDGVEMLENPSGAVPGTSSRLAKSFHSIRGLQQKKILLVEDGDTNRKLISLVLRRAGVEVATAENGPIGVEWATNTLFDLILRTCRCP